MKGRIAARYKVLEGAIVSVVVAIIVGFSPTPGHVTRCFFQGSAAAHQVRMVATSLDQLRMDCGRYPSTREGLDALLQKPQSFDGWRGPYVNSAAVLSDPWGRALLYRSPGDGDRPYDLSSLGADGVAGGEGANRDVHSWESDHG